MRGTNTLSLYSLQGQSLGMLYMSMYMYMQVVAGESKNHYKVCSSPEQWVRSPRSPSAPFEPHSPPVGAACKRVHYRPVALRGKQLSHHATKNRTTLERRGNHRLCVCGCVLQSDDEDIKRVCLKLCTHFFTIFNRQKNPSLVANTSRVTPIAL